MSSHLGPAFVDSSLMRVLGAPLSAQGVITPPTLTADVDNYSPTGLATANVVRLAGDNAVAWEIRGILAPPTDQRMLIIQNIGTANPLALIHDASTSTAANRIYYNGGVAGGRLGMASGQCYLLIYDNSVSRWRVLSAFSGDYTTTPQAPSGAGSAGSSPYFSPQNHVHPATDIAVDTIWAAAGDIVQATGNDAAARLAIGSAFQVPRVNSGATALEYAGGLNLIGDSGVLGADATSIDFSSIPATYAHLVAFLYGRSDQTGVQMVGVYVRINNISTATYDYIGTDVLATVASGYSSSGATEIFAGEFPANNATANLFGSSVLFFPNYSDGSNRKTMLMLSGGIDTESGTKTAWEFDAQFGKNRANTAINRLTFLSGTTLGTNKFKAGSRATLYGLGV